MARLSSIAQRHARWGAADEAQKAAGAGELRDLAGDRPDLLAEAAGIAVGADASRGAEYEARARVIAELCQMAGADEQAIPAWIEEGKRRVEARRMPPFSQPGRHAPRRP